MNYQMKIAICDDDMADRAALARLLEEYIHSKNYHIKIDEFSNGEAFLSEDISVYDLVILDIYMDGINGIETAKKLVRSNPRTRIIFCSSSNAYAAESYDLEALRYLTKPVQREKLFDTLDRFLFVHTAMRTLQFKRNRMDEWIFIADLMWVEADGHRCILHTRTGDIITRTPFAQLWDQLKDADFVKPIRYALVSLQAVATIPAEEFTLADGTTVPISRDLRPEMKRAFSDYKMKKLLQKGGIQ